MGKWERAAKGLIVAPIAAAVLVGLHCLGHYNYTLFHSIAEGFCIVIAISIFVLAWNTRRFIDNNYLLFLGIASLFIGIVDGIHALAYKGMGVFNGYDANLPTQLWISARYLHSLSFLVAPLFLRRSLRTSAVLGIYSLVTASLLLSIFYWDIFPACYVEGAGLTPFKVTSEYFIAMVFLASLGMVIANRQLFAADVLWMIAGSILFNIAAELAFTQYRGVYDFENEIGHFCKIGAYYLLYRAIIVTGLSRPYDFLFRNLKQSEAALEKSNLELERRVAQRASELQSANEHLHLELAERKRVEETTSRLAAIVQSSEDAIIGKTLDGIITSWNKGAADIYGYTESDVIGKPISILVPPHFKDDVPEILEKIKAGERIDHYETVRRRKDGQDINMALTVSSIRDEEGRIVAASLIGRDITAQKRAEQIMQARLRLLEFANSHTMDELLTATLDEIEALTGSTIGFYHFLGTDQKTLSLQNWSTNTVKHLCTASGKGGHYDLSEAGVWVDCIRERRLVIHNDYATLEHRKGLPEGHAPVHREAVVPIFRDGLIKAVIGIGNKSTNYDESDIEILSQLADLSWDITQRKRAEEELGRVNRALRMLSDTNQAQIRIMDEATLLNKICRICVEVGGYLMAWVGFAENDQAKTLRPAAHAGFNSGYIDSANVTWGDDERGRGPGGTAIRTGQPCISRNIPKDPAFAPWRQAAIQRGYKSIIALPLINESQTLGALFIYSGELDAFDTQEVEILKEMADDLAFGITALHTQTMRELAEEALRHSEKEKTILNQIASAFLTISDDEMYGNVLDIVLGVMESKFGMFGYIDEHGTLINPSLTRGIWSECQVPDKSIVFPCDSWGDSLWGKAIREKRTFSSDGPFRIPGGHVPIEHLLAVPVVYGEKTIGLISVANKEGGYTKSDRDLLEHIAANVSPILNARRQRDIEEQRRISVEKTLKESEEKYRLLVANAGEAILIVQDGGIKFPNPKALEWTGFSPEELAEAPFTAFIHSEDRDTVYQKYLERMKGGHPPEGYPFRIMKKGGGYLWVQLTAASITWEGKLGTLCFLRDITEEKLLKAQLRQAQKLEAIGQLAGGVAHDFNNILSVINGFAELALLSLPEENPLRHQIEEIRGAGERAAGLTRQLLAFSRKQVLSPKVFDLNLLVRGIEKMLKRLIGEDIELLTCPAGRLWPMKADPGQIEQIIMNLAVNARDAMPAGGKLTIETANVQLDEQDAMTHLGAAPGSHVMLAIKDNGCGMDQETLSRAFEPFFTTKTRERGTGLGLATVYGIVKQSGGSIQVCSEPGEGTIFKLYFPRAEEVPTEERTIRPVAETGAGETVLVVEDEEAVRRLIVQILEHRGYKVLTARNGNEALFLCERHTDPIALLVTDVIMPQMGGRELANRLAELRPAMRVLFMSGYTGGSILCSDKLEPATQFIQKPFSAEGLLAKIRDTLENGKGCPP